MAFSQVSFSLLIVHPLIFNLLFFFFASITMHEPVRRTWDVDCIT